MQIDELRDYCLAKPGTTESTPFDEVTLVFKVMNKMYALTGLEREPQGVNLKCDPEWVEELRAQYAGILPGYHMSKVHWNTVLLQDDVPDREIIALIDHSYDLVVASLPKYKQRELAELSS